jgi:uncharacterized protein
MNYDTPGIYVEEVSTGTKPIEGASTTTAAFLGVAPVANAYVDEPRACNSWTEFVRDFVADDSQGTDLARAVYGFFMNGGRRCYVVNIGSSGTIAGDARKGSGVHALSTFDEPSMVAAPGYTDAADYRALLDHAESMKDRVAILDGPQRVADVKELTEVASADAPSGGGEGGEGAEGETPAARRRGARAASTAKRPPDSKYGAVYFPWLVIRDPFGKENVAVPPSGHIAGVYAQNDVTRGVHKAPANYPIRTALGLTQRITSEAQGVLNKAGVSCIRFFSDSGIRIWGARTLSSDPEWRYVNVRRLFNMIESSIGAGTRWCVFEPNDQITRNSIARDVRAFLKLQWLAGALVGATPEQAFFVKCDAENNPPEVVDAGRLVVDIGIAPSKPAEFVVFRIGQWSGGTDVQSAA